jgi:hypothetical protein
MAIVVKALSTNYTVEIKHEEEKLRFIFNQLDYRTKSLVTSLTSEVKNGSYISDSTMQIFYNLKYGLKKVEGLEDEDGKPYKLEFEDVDNKVLTDACVDALLATPFNDNLQYVAHRLSLSTLPTEIIHPLTLQKIEGVEVIPVDGIKKK